MADGGTESGRIAATEDSPSVRVVHIAFLDFWPGFPWASNFFLRMLHEESSAADTDRAAASRARPTTRFEFVGQPRVDPATTDLVIFSCFGGGVEARRAPADIPKVFFTGEAYRPLEGADMYLTFAEDQACFARKRDGAAAPNVRFPLWMLSLDWWATRSARDAAAAAEPRPSFDPFAFDLSLATRVESAEPTSSTVDGTPAAATAPRRTHARPYDVSFVVTNPANPFRNGMLEALLAVPGVSVRSGGRYRNNVGFELKSDARRTWEEVKLDFLRDHAIDIAFENVKAPGYVTEKLIHGKLAGCVPAYWGAAAAAASDFDPRGFLDVSAAKTADEAARAVVDLLRDPARLQAMREVPLLTPVFEARARDRLRRATEAMIGLVLGRRRDAATVPT